MKLEIYKEEEKIEQTLRMKIEEYQGRIELTALDNSGKWWSVLAIRTNGTLWKYSGVPSDIGFDVDSSGRIISYED